MAGRGPAPGANPNRKDPSTRARRNSSEPTLRVIAAEPVVQPPLPDREWHPETLEWWRMWAESPLAADLTEIEWFYLRDTALIHSALWEGDLRQAAELRQRCQKFGVTPEDRARLRITFAAAEEADEKRPTRASSRSRREGLRLAE